MMERKSWNAGMMACGTPSRSPLPWRLGEPRKILHVSLQVEGPLVFKHVEGLDTYGLCDIEFRIALGDSLCHQPVEGLPGLGRLELQGYAQGTP